jgi:hypothetical protein
MLMLLSQYFDCTESRFKYPKSPSFFKIKMII